ncbi:MAG: hypothetical protein GF329_20135 [Candidatus Lokiarchaeota archaeon]|nr:hypothetical protein [Candidatus Lokiarchaeota archaeon]
MKTTTKYTIKIAGAAIFGALSIVFYALIVPFIPRIPGWGLAYIDPVSIIWVLCFFIFGTVAGLICTGIGTIALFFLDPLTPVGPIMKLIATLPMILIPVVMMKIKKSWEFSSKTLVSKKLIYMTGVAILIRIPLMIGMNILAFEVLFGVFFPEYGVTSVDAAAYMWPIPGISNGLLIVLIVVSIINSMQGLWDILVPFLLFKPTTLVNYAQW